MFDIHNHILPGVDDGTDTLADALQMLHLAAEGGTPMCASSTTKRWKSSATASEKNIISTENSPRRNHRWGLIFYSV